MAERNLEKELKGLKSEFSDAKNEEIRLQTRLEESKKRRKEASDRIKDEGYDVKSLPSVIATKEKELAAAIDEIKTYLPGEQADDDGEEDWD